MDDQTNSNSNDIFKLIQNIQSKLNNDETKNEINNLQNNMQNENITYNTNKNPDFDFSSIISMLGNNKNNENNNFSDETNSFDINNIFKLQKLFSSIGKNDPKRNLLISLKPFLRKSRQDKLNEYIMLLTIGDALGIFGSRGENDDK